ncbi:MAG TPA: zf-HC2 domain-containing protein [Planctomycetes bacterium]|nr:zf-HC2 domain-containing protein [Planctomycetota bacterium]HIL38376.1 zf-HC2 domain-containing protein [Planctomycetota bacterium]
MIMKCEAVKPLVAGYLDNELSESQAAPVRQHLLDCAGCRNEMQSQTAQKSWFVPTEPIAVPDGFATRVSRRAFAGDKGLLVPAPRQEVQRGEARILQFVIQMTAVAAVVLLILALGMKFNAHPEGSELRADSSDLREALEVMERLNREEQFQLPQDNPPGASQPEATQPVGSGVGK